jgi:3-hydroxybutyryl-CoA dehydrogenase
VKTITNIRRIAVVGAGTMGSGIAQICAQAGYETVLYDVLKSAADHGYDVIRSNLQTAIDKQKLNTEERDQVLSRINVTSDLDELVSDVVIEAIVERRETKAELFSRIAILNDDEEAIFCSNTSSIPITRLAQGIPNPERIVGMHFFNPAHIMKLVEIVSGVSTDAQVTQCISDLAVKLGKIPVMVKDSPGFIVNRIGKLFHTEPLKILEENIASVETIDALMESSGFRMGPFRLMDFIGLDVNLSVTKSLFEQFYGEPKFRPSRIQQQLVDSGFLGRKAKRGFYRYS